MGTVYGRSTLGQRPPLGLLAMPTNSGSEALVRRMTAAVAATPPGRASFLGYVAGAPVTSSWALVGPFIPPWLAARVVRVTHVFQNSNYVIFD
jgi:hypothetical protein